MFILHQEANLENQYCNEKLTIQKNVRTYSNSK
jgi:hypothetical protein